MSSRYVLGPDIDLDAEVVLDKRGRRITEQRAQRLASDALDRVGAGRPSLTAPGEHSPEIKARVPADMRDRLRSVAQQRGVSTSQLVREALDRYLAS